MQLKHTLPGIFFSRWTTMNPALFTNVPVPCFVFWEQLFPKTIAPNFFLSTSFMFYTSFFVFISISTLLYSIPFMFEFCALIFSVSWCFLKVLWIGTVRTTILYRQHTLCEIRTSELDDLFPCHIWYHLPANHYSCLRASFVSSSKVKFPPYHALKQSWNLSVCWPILKRHQGRHHWNRSDEMEVNVI